MEFYILTAILKKSPTNQLINYKLYIIGSVESNPNVGTYIFTGIRVKWLNINNFDYVQCKHTPHELFK
jgi:hypothetical protein